MFKYINHNDLIKLANNSDVLVVLDRQIFDGVITTLLDIHLNLTTLGISAPLIMIIRDPKIAINFLTKYKKSLLINNITIYAVTVNDIHNTPINKAIVSFGAMRWANDYGVLQIQDRLIVLGSGTILYDKLCNNSKGINYTNSLADKINVKILGNECQRQYFKNDVYTVYRQKFSLQRLNVLANNFIPKDHNFNELERLNYKKSHLTEDNMYAKSLYYQRWNEIIPGVYNENIGKLIFEFRWLNRPVHYSSINRSHADGLTEYLALFGVDDTITQDLTFTKEDINKLLVGLTHDDILVKTIFE